MSILSTCEIKCSCDEVFESELWKAVSISDDPDLKNLVLSGQFNVVECPKCHKMFYWEHFFVYQDIANEFVAYVYPKSYEKDAAFYRQKMLKEFKEVASTMKQEIDIDFEPVLFFGIEDLISAINSEDYLKDEIDVLKFIAKEIDLDLVTIKPSIARNMCIPHVLPKHKKADTVKQNVVNGLEKLVSYNPHLTEYKKLFERISADVTSLEKILLHIKKSK